MELNSKLPIRLAVLKPNMSILGASAAPKRRWIGPAAAGAMPENMRLRRQNSSIELAADESVHWRTRDCSIHPGRLQAESRSKLNIDHRDGAMTRCTCQR